MTTGFDAQRSSWVRADGKINPKSMAAPGFELVWKYKLKGPSTPPALIDFYIGYRGFRTLGFFGSQANTITGIDTDLGRQEWEKTYAAPQAGSGNCPGGMTSAVTRPTTLAYPMNPGSGGAGRGTPAKSGVGEALQGAVTLRRTPPPPPPPAPKPTPGAAAAAAAANPFAPRVQYVNGITGDGLFHSLWISNGEEPKPGIPFVPAGANAQGLVVVNGFAYVGTAHNCGGAPNAVWSLDVATGKVNSWKAAGKGVAGSAGPAIAPNGTVYAATMGGELVALEEKTLAEKAKFSNPAVEFSSSPVIFNYKGKDMIAVTSADGRLHVFDSASLSQPVAQSSVFAQPGYAVGALASWQDIAGTRWILVPTGRNITALKLTDEGGTFKLERAWASRSLINPLTPIVVSGVVFAAAGGDANSPAVLYAMDALTGKDVWSSAATITSYARSGGLSAGGSRVYLSTVDGTQYVFGFPMEH